MLKGQLLLDLMVGYVLFTQKGKKMANKAMKMAYDGIKKEVSKNKEYGDIFKMCEDALKEIADEEEMKQDSEINKEEIKKPTMDN